MAKNTKKTEAPAKKAPAKKAPAKKAAVAKLAIDGGEKVWKEPFPMWPQFNPDTDQKVLDILHSGKVNYWTGPVGMQFEEAWAKWLGVKNAISVSNGTAALHVALRPPSAPSRPAPSPSSSTPGRTTSSTRRRSRRPSRSARRPSSSSTSTAWSATWIRS